MKKLLKKYGVGIAVTSLVFVAGFKQSNEATKAQEAGSPESGADVTSSECSSSSPSTYSAFGTYTPLPTWSTWCGVQADEKACAEPLKQAVSVADPSKQTPDSRPTVRAHGWQLWPAIWSEIQVAPFRNNAALQKTDLYGTTGCWSRFGDDTPACSGVYPIWMTWPNTGRPYKAGLGSAAQTHRDSRTLLQINRDYTEAAASRDPDPTKTQTVNTDPAPNYNLPPLVLSKQCGISTQQAKEWLDKKKYEDIKTACDAAGATNMFCLPKEEGNPPKICDGVAFVNQGDVMIATESLSVEGYNDIQNNELYGNSGKLQSLYEKKDNAIPSMIHNKYISTKHMFWPVKGCKPGVAKVGDPGCRVRSGALPPWIPKNFKQYSYATNADYLGYEKWKQVVAIDTCTGTAGACPSATSATLALAHVTGKGFGPITTDNPDVYPVSEFVHVQISEEVLKKHFTTADRALLDQATIWAYGDESNGFEAGDFLVVIAMHITTKELDTWAFQSVWWSPSKDALSECPLNDYDHCFGQAGAYAATSEPGVATPNQYSGLTEKDITDIDAEVGTAWRDRYLLTDSYGINYELDGTRVNVKNYFEGPPPIWATTGPSGSPMGRLPVSANVYIEPVIHPIGTNCQNCHRRAGYPGKSCSKAAYPKGCGRANYQTAQCADLMGDYGNPVNDPCMMTPWAWYESGSNHCKEDGGTKCDKNNNAYPVLNTNYIWIIADQHIQPR